MIEWTTGWCTIATVETGNLKFSMCDHGMKCLGTSVFMIELVDNKLNKRVQEGGYRR